MVAEGAGSRAERQIVWTEVFVILSAAKCAKRAAQIKLAAFRMILKKTATSFKGARNRKTRRTPVVIFHLMFICAGMLLMFLIQVFLPPHLRWFGHPRQTEERAGYKTAGRAGLRQPWGEIQ